MQTVGAKLTPNHVHRGKPTRLVVTAGTGTAVTVVVAYLHHKPATFHGKVSSAGTYTKKWRIPKNVKPGKTRVRVAIDGVTQPLTVILVIS